MAIVLQKEDRIDYLRIILGTGMMAFSVNFFFTPANMVPGGFTGLSIIIHRLTQGLMPGGIPVWAVNLMLNIPLILAAIKIRGWAFMRRTFAAAILYSFWMFLIPEMALVKNDLVVAAVVGGATMGCGLGFVFLGRATTGGTDTVAALIKRFKPHWSTSAIYPVLDIAVVALSAWIFGPRISIYAALGLFLAGRVTEWVITGLRGTVNQAMIVSDKHEEIAQAIMRELNRGVTSLKGVGMYTKQERPVLLCAVAKRQTVLLREIVFSIDESAFMILSDAKDIRGEGFLSNSYDEL